VTTLSSEDALQIAELNAVVGQPAVRYRTYAFVTSDQLAMASMAQYVESDLYGTVLDVLDGSISDRELVTMSPMSLLEWVGNQMGDRAPRVLVHTDTVLSTWMRIADHRLWWTQIAMIEQIGPLYVLTARNEINQVESWGFVDSIWVGEAKIRAYAPIKSVHYELLRDGREQ
jgi:hypothetical protein